MVGWTDATGVKQALVMSTESQFTSGAARDMRWLTS
jgi:hypothetical protein